MMKVHGQPLQRTNVTLRISERWHVMDCHLKVFVPSLSSTKGCACCWQIQMLEDFELYSELYFAQYLI